MTRRRELVSGGTDAHGNPVFDLDSRRLFYGHSLDAGSSFDIKSSETDGDRWVRYLISDQPSVITIDEGNDRIIKDPLEPALFLEINGEKSTRFVASSRVKLTPAGGLRSDRRHGKALESLDRVELVAIESSSYSDVAEGWSHIALTPHESLVEESLRLVAPSLERLAYVQDTSAIGGVFRAKLAEFAIPVPLGSMGDGVWRMLAIVIGLVRARNGFLLIDEIDTGLHHTVIPDVWRILLSTAERLNVQVFATTHSLDCVRGLARVCLDSESESVEQDRVSMHRIERGKPESIHYAESEIVIAADEGIETR